MTRTSNPIDLARDAIARQDWPAAIEHFTRADEAERTPGDLNDLAWALWWTSRVHESVEWRQRAYAAAERSGDRQAAAHAAWVLAVDFRLMGEASLASGWLMRAKRDLQDLPECKEHGLVLLEDSALRHAAGDFEGARAFAEQAAEMGKRIDDADLLARGISTMGRHSIYLGRSEEGAQLLDEAMVMVTSGLVSPVYMGWIYCDVLATCFEVADVRRASEWTAAAARWTDSIPGISPFHGVCRVHRVEMATLRGEWDDAEREGERASEDLALLGPGPAAGAVYALGEIRRRRGDLPGAEERFARAHGLGREPQPGLALIRLAQGKAEAATNALRLALGDGGGPLARASLLAARVEAALSTGDIDDASAACTELDAISERWPSPLLEATSKMACAARSLATGDAAGAVADARRATKLLTEMRFPYDAALARIRTGLACRAAGDEDHARLELSAARAELERLGARLDAERAAALLEPRAPAHGLSEREVEVLRLVAGGKTNREIAADIVISEHTVSRHLQNIFRKIGVSTRAGATAYAFEHGLMV